MKIPIIGFGLVALAVAAGAAEAPLVLRSQATHGGSATWLMQRAGDARAEGAAISTPGFPTAGWQNAVVPGTVLNSLVKNGVYPEPYFGLNNAHDFKRIPDLKDAGPDFYTYWFRTEFALTPEFAGRRTMLELDGINYRAEIWLNGQKLGDLAGMFQRGFFDITAVAKAGGPNVLAVRVRPPDTPGNFRPKKGGGGGAVGENSNGGDHTYGKNVSMLMSVGWDFTLRDGVRDRNTGIWKDVKVYPVGPVALRDPQVRTKLPLPQLAPARETVVIEAINLTGAEQKGVLRGKIPGASVTLEQPVTLAAGETRTLSFTPEAFPQLVIAQPQLWWPLNKGAQHLYNLELEFVAADGRVSDRSRSRFGIREITSDQQTPGQDRIFYVNGQRLFIRGSNWTPEAMCRGSDARTYAELRWTAQAGVNLLRQWGGGITESDYFYDLCDELGILVWTEFWQTGDTLLPAEPELYRANFADTVKRIRHHASNAYYVSANERDGKSVIPVKDLIDQLDGTTGWQPGSETDGIHDGSPYWTCNPMWYYEDSASERGSRIYGFNPEYGCPCLPTIDCLREMMDEKDIWPVNKNVWDYLDGGGFHRMSSDYLRAVEQYGPIHNAEELAMRAQAFGGLANRAIWECWSRNKFEFGDRFGTGFLFWYHNSPEPQVCGRLWDYSLEPTAALYFTQKATEPRHAQFDFLKNGVSVVNELKQPFAGRVTLRVLDAALKEILKQDAAFAVAADAVTNDVIKVTWPAQLPPVQFLKLELRDTAGTLVSDNFYWRSDKAYRAAPPVPNAKQKAPPKPGAPLRSWTGPQYEGFESLADLPRVAVAAQFTKKQEHGWARYTGTVRNPSKSLAFFVWLRLQDAATGKPVRPAFFNDNFLILLPGESKSITIEHDERVTGAQPTQLVVDGWNIEKQTLKF